MSSYNKHAQPERFGTAHHEKKAMLELLATEMQIDSDAALQNLKASIAGEKKHSSATLLRRKLQQAALVRAFQNI